MAIVLRTPEVDELSDVLAALRDWQYDDAPFQLHPGDLGWFWRFGADATATAVRAWRLDGQIVAIGLLDTPKVLRLTIAPEFMKDEELAQQLVADLTQSERGVLLAGEANIELPVGALLHELLTEEGWGTDEPWSPLRRDLSRPVEDPGVRIEVVRPDHVDERVAVQRAAFDGSTFSDERWRAMAGGPAYGDARCLVAYDEQGNAVATATVWSAGVGRPGLLEPLGTHRDHRGRGYGRAISIAAAAALRDLGSSSAIVCTPSSNTGAVATYKAAGFEALPEVRDRRREP